MTFATILHGHITPIVQLLRNPIFNYEFVSRYPIECVRFEGVVPAAWFKKRIVHPLHEHFYAFKLPTAKPLTKTPHGPNNEEEYRVDTIYLEEHDLIRVQLRPVLADDDLRGFVVEQPDIPGIERVLGRESSRVHRGYFYFPNFRLCSTRGYLLPAATRQSRRAERLAADQVGGARVRALREGGAFNKPSRGPAASSSLVASAKALVLHTTPTHSRRPPRCPPQGVLCVLPSGNTGTGCGRRGLCGGHGRAPAFRAVARSARNAATEPRGWRGDDEA